MATLEEITENLSNFENFYPKENPLQTRLTNFTRVAHRIDHNKKFSDFLLENAENTYLFLDSSVIELIKDFLLFKSKKDSAHQEFYLSEYPELQSIETPTEITSTTIQLFIIRLMTKRTLEFCLYSDCTIDRNDVINRLTSKAGESVPESKRKKPTIDYISYDEMQISAFLQISSPSLFINDGNRFNAGIYDQTEYFISQGIVIGSVGARFEKPGLMEYQHMLVTPTQNTPENGYGINGEISKKTKLEHWAKFYELPFFPSYQEANEIYKTESLISDKARPKTYVTTDQGGYLNVPVYKTRIKKVIEAFLTEANQRSTKEKPAYIHAIGLGTGAWAVSSKFQEELILQVYTDILRSYRFENIQDLDFSWFNQGLSFNGIQANNEGTCENALKDTPNPDIRIHFSRNNPAGYGKNYKTQEEMKHKTLIMQYAWDSGSFVGNEYWHGGGSLRASSDPAAACHTQIAEIQNPQINPVIRSNPCNIALHGKLFPLIASFFVKPHNTTPIDTVLFTSSSDSALIFNQDLVNKKTSMLSIQEREQVEQEPPSVELKEVESTNSKPFLAL